MNLQQFEQMLDQHGAELERWPETERQAAEDLISKDLAAAQLYRAQQIVEAALGETEALEPSAELLRRVAEIPTRNPLASRDAAASGLPVWLSFWKAAVYGLSCASAGLAVGWFTPAEIDEADSFAALTAEQSVQEVEQLDALALSSEYLVSSLDWEESQ